MSRNLDREAAVRHLVPINRLPPENQEALLRACEFQTVFDGQVVYAQGHQDDYVHYLIDGTVELLWNGKVVKRLPATSKAARRALDKPGRKRHTVRAVSNCIVLRIPRPDFDMQLDEGSLLTGPRQVEVSEIAAEKSSNWMIKMLQSDLFERLPAINIQKIFGRMERVEVEADQVVVKQGDEGDYYYVIERGYCEVSRHILGGKEIHLADLGAGDAFGEGALIGSSTRDASVTMLADGALMRLSRDDFNELIRDPLLRGISPTVAIAQIDAGAGWLDVRYPEDCAKSRLRRSRNIPFNVLRLQANRLDKDKKYIVCCEDSKQSAVGAFLLIERGVNVVYLDESVSNLVAEHPSTLAPRATQKPGSGKVVAFNRAKTGSRATPIPKQSEESDMDEHRPDGDSLENTIDKIDRLYSQKEWEAEKAARVPIEDYAHTVTGQRLADLIDEMDENRERLPAAETPAEPAAGFKFSFDDVIDIAPDASAGVGSQEPNVLLVDTHAPLPVSRDETLRDGDDLFEDSDGLSEIVRDFERRVRDHVETVARRRTNEIEGHYQHKIKRIRTAAAVEVRKRQELSRQRYEQQYKKKELKLRAHYKKLMALANKISQQKAQLQIAKKQFEDKLSAANAVYQQVEDMRKSLRQHISDLPPDVGIDTRQSA